MPVKLRLRRQGRKGQPYYHIVAADSRSSRDGKFIEKVGSYDPTKSPAVIDVDHSKALNWLKSGAQPTDTVRAILRYTGVNLKFALQKQGKDQETQDRIFNAWNDKKLAAVQSKTDKQTESKKRSVEDQLKADRKKRLDMEAKIMAKHTPPPAPVETPVAEVVQPVAEVPAAEVAATETPVVETPVVETPVVETPVVETPVVETPVVETPVVEATTETPAAPESGETKE